jgi:hypothetical protein
MHWLYYHCKSTTTLVLPYEFDFDLRIYRATARYVFPKTAAIFLISRTIGSAFRLYLVVIVLQRFVLILWYSFAMTVLISLALIFAYTYRGGLKRSLSLILYKHFFLVTSIFLTIVFICNSLDFSAIEAFEAVKTATTLKYSFEDFISSKFHFVKQIVGGIFVTIAMVGLDQDLMQKIWCCHHWRSSKKHVHFYRIFVDYILS